MNRAKKCELQGLIKKAGLMALSVFFIASFAHAKPVKKNQPQVFDIKGGVTLLSPVQSDEDRKQLNEKYKEDLFNYEKSRLLHTYSPKTEYQMYLPLDIADIPVFRVKTGYQSNFDLIDKKDKLSVYLLQNKQAQHFFGLYKQRILAWNAGIPASDATVEIAMNQEALYPFLTMVLDSDRTTPEMMAYFEKRLGSKDMDNLRNWVLFNSETSTLLDVLANELVKQRLSAEIDAKKGFKK